MAVDVLILNTAVVDYRHKEFAFTNALAGAGGLAKCDTADMPDYSQQQMKKWIDDGFATAGGPGNTVPLIARTGLKVAVGVNLGKGDYDGLDAQGRFFYDTMTENGVDMSATVIHPSLPTGTTFIHDIPGSDRGGIVYFPNANNDFDFEQFKPAVERLQPAIVYYMYSGLSDRGDANGGRDLADFIKWCRGKGIVTIVDSHTLTGNPQQIIDTGQAVDEYKLLAPMLGELDVFFTSCDEAKMIENTLTGPRDWSAFSDNESNIHFLEFLTGRFWTGQDRSRLFGVTVKDGAFEKHICPDGILAGPNKVQSAFMAGEIVDLVGAGDSFRAGLITYIAANLQKFKSGTMDFTKAVQMGNLFASLYIKSPLNDRYGNIRPFEKMLAVIDSKKIFKTSDELKAALA